MYPGVSCLGAPENGLSTSCGNHQFGNRMGQAPPGFEYPGALERYGVPHGEAGSETLPNGTDFWWDEFLVEPLELLVRQHRPGRDAGERHRPGRRGQPARRAAEPAARLRRRREPGPEPRQRRRRQGGLPRRLLGGPGRGHRPAGLRLVDAAGPSRAAPPPRRAPARSRAPRRGSGNTPEAQDAAPPDGGPRRVATLAAQRQRSHSRSPSPLACAGCGGGERPSAKARRRPSRSARAAPVRSCSSPTAATGGPAAAPSGS